MKKLIALTMAIAMVLTQSGIASAAFTSDVKTAAITASVDLSGGAVVKTLTVAVKKFSDGSNATAIGWTGVNLGDEWKKSVNYVEVTYAANLVYWGIQIYTDNTSVTANPKYAGDPTKDPAQQPAGLIGTVNKLLTCPIAILVADTNTTSSRLTDAELKTPLQSDPDNPGSYFIEGYNKKVYVDPVTLKDTHEIVWFFLKDITGTVWEDANNNNVIDTGELKKNFNKTSNPAGYPGKDDYATIVNTYGASSGWIDTKGTTNPDDDVMWRVAGPVSPIQVYFAANFKRATELQEYKTNTITLELYHE